MVRLLALLCASSVTALMAGGAMAADPAPAAPATTLGEVIITAQQRGENLQKSALPVDAVKGSELVAAGVTSIDNLTKLVPALVVQGTANGNLIFIRGVGNFTLQPASDPASAYNYDGVYIGRPTSNAGAFYDLQRIEVLKGPQGTLYGRNATAGAINIIPTQPVIDKFGGYATVGYGNYNTVTAEGAVNLPLGDKTALRISGGYARHDGYVSDGTSDDNSGGVRAQLKSEITPDVTVRLSADYAHQGGKGEAGTYIGKFAFNSGTGQYVETPSGISPSEGILTPESQAFRETVTAGATGRTLGPIVNEPFEDNKFYGTHAQIDWRTAIGTFTVIPAWREAEKHNLATSAGFLIGDSQGSDQYSIEARLVSNPGKIIDYNLGVYYFDERITDRQSASTQGAASFTNSNYKTHSPAAYGRLTWHVTDQFRVTGGLRYTSDSKSFNSASSTVALVCLSPAGCPTSPLLPYTTTLAGQPYIPPANGVLPISATEIAKRIDATAASGLDGNKTTFRAALEYDVAPHSLAYASVETGYRSGGFNTAAGYLTYAPEEITAYTLGMKNRFFENRLQLNLEAFDWEYKNQQLSNLGLDATGRPTVITKNIGQSSIRGAEAEVQYLVEPHTIVSADLQYVDGVYHSFLFKAPTSSGLPYTGCAVSVDATTSTLYDVNCSGKPLANSPKWTLNAGIEHTIPMETFDVVLSANTQLRSGRYTGPDYIATEYQGSTSQTDAQIQLNAKANPWSLAFYVHNIEDKRYLVYGSPSVQANLILGDYSAPRTYGLRFTAKY